MQVRSIRINLGATFAGRTSEIFHDGDGCVLANETAQVVADSDRVSTRRDSRIKAPGCPQGRSLPRSPPALFSLSLAVARLRTVVWD